MPPKVTAALWDAYSQSSVYEEAGVRSWRAFEAGWNASIAEQKRITDAEPRDYWTHPGNPAERMPDR